MKIQGRIVTLCISLAFASCVLTLAIRAFAQTSQSSKSSDFTITFKEAPLKDDYAEDASSPDGKFKKLLDAKGKSYDVVGKDKHEKPINYHKTKLGKSGTNPTASANNSSEIIRVVDAPTPATSGTPPMITGVNVTQQVTTASAAEMTDVLNAFQ